MAIAYWLVEVFSPKDGAGMSRHTSLPWQLAKIYESRDNFEEIQ